MGNVITLIVICTWKKKQKPRKKKAKRSKTNAGQLPHHEDLGRLARIYIGEYNLEPQQLLRTLAVTLYVVNV
jgi:hypothetical protein